MLLKRLPLIAALALPALGLAQVPSTEQQYLDFIEQERNKGGPSSRALIEPMTALGLFYFERKDYDRAAETLARARGVMRAADGFDTLPEAALIAHQVRVEEARGDIEAAWKLEQSMLAVAKRHAGELGTVPVFRDMARKRRGILERYRNGEYPPQIVVGCYYDREVMLKQLFVVPLYDPPDTCTSGDRTNVMTALLGDMRTNQLFAMEALFQNGLYASDEMQELLADVLSLSEQIRLWLPRAVAIDEVLDQYRRAYALLEREGVEQAMLDEVFSPAVPVVLPAYRLNPLHGGDAGAAKGYIDVTFNVTQRGASRRIRVAGASEGVERADRNRLSESIRRGTFRPRMVNGEFPAAPVRLRYYLN